MTFPKTAITAAILVAVPFAANAAPVATWDVTSTSSFVTDETRPVPVDGSSRQTNASTRLAWNDGMGNESALRLGDNDVTALEDVVTTSVTTVGVNGVSRGDITDPATLGQGVTLTHENKSLFLDGTPVLTSGELMTTAEFVATDGSEITVRNEINIPFFFQETPNEPAGGVCANGGPSTAAGACSDLWVTPGNALSDTFVAGPVDEETTYRATFFPSGGVAMLDEETCGVFGLDAGCLGFTTDENADTSVTFFFEVAAVPLPPAVLLLASGLVGAGLVSRRRRQAAA